MRRNLETAALAQIGEAEPVVRLLTAVFSRGHDPEHNPILRRLGNPVRGDADAIAAYLRGEVGLGRVRPLDADVTALTVMGALTHFIHREHILPPEPGREVMDAGRFVRGLFDQLWPGLRP